MPSAYFAVDFESYLESLGRSLGISDREHCSPHNLTSSLGTSRWLATVPPGEHSHRPSIDLLYPDRHLRTATSEQMAAYPASTSRSRPRPPPRVESPCFTPPNNLNQKVNDTENASLISSGIIPARRYRYRLRWLVLWQRSSSEQTSSSVPSATTRKSPTRLATSSPWADSSSPSSQ
jgi:hypothetical protein